MRLTIDWAHSEHFPVTLFCRGSRGRVILMSGLSDNVRVLHLLQPNDHVICFTVGDYGEAAYRTMRGMIRTFALDAERVSVLCNTLAQVAIAQDCGLKADFCNKNAFIDEQLFRIQPIQKCFDAVSNARLVKQKRVHLARLVENLAIIRGHELELAEYDDPERIPHAYLSRGLLTAREVVRVLSASRVGLALSSAEGACQASSEYLLCGLPVVSTPSTGGRDIWYGEHNSLVCEPTPEAVRDAVRHLIRRLTTGEIDPHRIREHHLAQAQEHRRRFVDVLRRALADVGAEQDPAELFARNLQSPGIAPRYVPFGELCQALQR